MKRLVGLLLAIICWTAHGQVVPISGQAVNQNGQPLPFASVRICSVTSTGVPCTPTATIYQDYGLSIPIANPTTADQYGNYLVYAGALSYPNLYVVQLSPASGITWSYVQAGPGAFSVGSPAFAVQFANSTDEALQGDSTFTFNPSTHTMTAQEIIVPGSGSGSIGLGSSGGGTFTQTVPTSLTSYSIEWPSAPPASGAAFLNCQTTPCTWTSSIATPASPAFAVQFANSGVSAFQGDSTFTFNPATHTLTADNVSATAVTSPSVNGTSSVMGYGATCSWNGSSGTDDTGAFQAAATAATNRYAITGEVTTITVPGSCVVGGTVTYGSGVYWLGVGGTIIVPTQTGYTFVAESADNVGWENLNIDVINSPGGDYAGYLVIFWEQGNPDAVLHHDVTIINNHIHNSVWGILVAYAVSGATGSVSNVNISGNTVDSPNPYENGDGIHVDGAVYNITIANNRIVNRADACIGITPEATGSPTNGIESGNVCFNDRVGIDMSGGVNWTIIGNNVQSVANASSFAASDPAFRMFNYGPIPPSNIRVIGNYFLDPPGNTDAASKVDTNGGYITTPPDCDCTFSGNTFGSNNNDAMYIRGNRITFSGNTMLPGTTLQTDYFAPSSITLASYSASGSTVSLVNTGTNGFSAGENVTFGVTGGPTCLNTLTLPVSATGLTATTFQVTQSGCSGSGVATGYALPPQIPTQNVIIGANNWLGNGTLIVGTNGGLSVNIQVTPQNVAGTFTNADTVFQTIPNGLAQTIQIAGCNFPSPTVAGNVCNQVITLPMQHTSTSYVVNCSLPTQLTGTGGDAPVITWTENNLNASQFQLYEQVVVPTSSGTTYPNYQVEVTCTTAVPL